MISFTMPSDLQLKYEKQDQQGRDAFNKRIPYTGPPARSPAGHQTGRAHNIILNSKLLVLNVYEVIVCDVIFF
jgi:hypothetical protein